MNYFPKFSKKLKETVRVEHQKGVIKLSVEMFSWLMTKELMKHLDRPGWKHEPIPYLIRRLNEELAELSKAIWEEQPKEVVEKEAAHVGSFAMMIADVYRQKCKPKKEEEKVQCPSCSRWVSIEASGCICELKKGD